MEIEKGKVYTSPDEHETIRITEITTNIIEYEILASPSGPGKGSMRLDYAKKTLNPA